MAFPHNFWIGYASDEGSDKRPASSPCGQGDQEQNPVADEGGALHNKVPRQNEWTYAQADGLGKDEIAIVDMEAGIEHFGRGIDNSIDAVLVVVEPSFESIALAQKIKDLASGINKKLWVVLNKINSQNLIAEIEAKLKNSGMETIGEISYDGSIFLSGLKGDTLGPEKSIGRAAKILDSLLPAET